MKKITSTKLLLPGLLLFTFTQTIHAQNFEWARMMGDTTEDFGNSIAVDAAGNSYTTGYFQGKVDFNPGTNPGDTFKLKSFGKKDIFLTKLNKDGNLIWTKQMGGHGDDIGTAVAISKSGYVYAMGSFNDTADLDPGTGVQNFIGAGFRDVSMCKFDTAGKLIWAKAIGGMGDDQVRSLAIDKNENLIFGGDFYATMDFDPSSSGVYNLNSNGWNDMFCCKLDSAGNFLWANAIGCTASDEAYGVAVDSSGGVYMTGRFQSACDFDPGAGTFSLTPKGLLDGFITKYNASGSFAWAKQFGGPGSDITGQSIVTTKTSEVFLAGEFKGTVDIDPSLSGIDSITPSGKHDVFIAKMDTAGKYIWSKIMGGPTGDDMTSTLTIDKNGNLYTTGYFYGVTDWDPSSAVAPLTSKGSWDVFISVLDRTGSYVWAKSFGGGLFDTGMGIAVDTADNVYTTGGFQYMCDFDPSSVTAYQIAAGKNDIYIHKMGTSNVGVASINNETVTFDFYPNPAVDNVTITVDRKLVGAKMQIMDVVGNIVMNSTISSITSTISLDQFAPGLYFIRIGQGTQAYKLIVE